MKNYDVYDSSRNMIISNNSVLVTLIGSNYDKKIE